MDLYPWVVQDSALGCEFVYGLQAWGEVPRQELLDTADGVIGYGREHMTSIGFGVDPVEPG